MNICGEISPRSLAAAQTWPSAGSRCKVLFAVFGLLSGTIMFTINKLSSVIVHIN